MSANLTPRLSTSTQWTDLPPEFLTKVKTVFTSQFEHEAAHGEFLVEGRVYPQEIVMRAGYLESGRLKQINFEASMDLPKPEERAEGALDEESAEEKSATMSRLYTCLDALGSLMEEYFQVGDESEMDVPLRWKPYDFEGDVVFLQHSTVNTRLEEEANRLLGLGDDKLFHEEEKSEDALVNADVDTDLAMEVQKAIRSGTYPKIIDDDSAH